MTLSTGSGQANGIITLNENKLYNITLTVSYTAGNDGYVGFSIYDVTNSASLISSQFDFNDYLAPTTLTISYLLQTNTSINIEGRISGSGNANQYYAADSIFIVREIKKDI